MRTADLALIKPALLIALLALAWSATSVQADSSEWDNMLWAPDNSASAAVWASSVGADPDNDGDGDPGATDPDDDNDGMPDTFELAYALDPLDAADAADAALDLEPDEFTNLQEYQAGTHPRNADTDNVGRPDGSDAFPLEPVHITDLPSWGGWRAFSAGGR